MHWPGCSMGAFRCIAVTMMVGSLSLSTTAVKTFGHDSNPINVFLDEEDRLYIGPTFDSGPFHQIAGTLLAANQPAIGVLSPGNHVPDQSALGLEILSDLYYWDGAEIAPTTSELFINAPSIDGFGNINSSPIPRYVVSATSLPQSGMIWGVYDDRSPGWDSHGEFLLFPFDSKPGIYGFMSQVSSAEHISTDPFFVPLLFDPHGGLAPSAIIDGVSALEATALPRAITVQAGDANRDLAFDQVDLIQVLQAGKYRTGLEATWGEGDWNAAASGTVGFPAAGDGLFDQLDLVTALQTGIYLSGLYVATTETAPVPEPTSVLLLVVGVVAIVATGRSFGRRYSIKLK